MNKKIICWIENNIDAHLTIGYISRHFGICRRSVQLIFKNEYNIPLGTYIRRRKISHAAILLMLTSESINEIASLLHYSCHQNFIRAFRAHFGVSPGEFRQYKGGDFSAMMHPTEFSAVLIEGSRMSHSEVFNSNKVMTGEDVLFAELVKFNRQQPGAIYQASSFSPDTERISTVNNIIQVKTVTGVLCQGTFSVDIHRIPTGHYASFAFEGTWPEFKQFRKKIYFEDLSITGMAPLLGISC